MTKQPMATNELMASIIATAGHETERAIETSVEHIWWAFQEAVATSHGVDQEDVHADTKRASWELFVRTLAKVVGHPQA